MRDSMNLAIASRVDMGDFIQIWERQPSEPEKAFLRFKRYREMGSKRSLRILASEEHVHLSTIAKMSAQFNWQSRAAAWDSHLDKVSQQNEIDEICAMKKRQITLALKAQKAASEGLEVLIKQIESTGGQEHRQAQINLMSLSKLLDTGCRLERLNRDEPEHNVEFLQQQSFDNLSLEEMEILRSLLLKAGAT
jgi:hypothetical protein